MALQNEFLTLSDEAPLDEISDLEMIKVETSDNSVPQFKRQFDFLIASILTFVLAPLLLLIFFSIKLSDGGPAIFKQKRIGRNGEEFWCWKFRTMVVDSDKVLKNVLQADRDAAAEWAADQKLKDDPRITRVGELLRKTSLDELPQLWNILKGEMSLVGPRPIVKSEIKKYGHFYRTYISVTPGLTGLWQVSGRNDTSYGDRVKMDVEYVKTRSFSRDLKILFMTIPAVLLTKGAY